jgi:CubicO group peptidase (beta-lactamase class C family)
MEPLRSTRVGAENRGKPNRKLRLRVSIFVLIALISSALVVVIYERWPREYFPRTTPGLAARVDTYIGQVMASRPAPGLAVGVFRGDAFVFAKGYGLQHLKEGGSVRPETVFHTASVSKTFVALAVMQLVERGQLDLDAPVTRFLPYFRLADPRSAEITVRQLLSHTSGLPTDVDGGNWWESPEQDPGALERYIRSLDKRSLVAGPGDKWHYSNMGYEVLGDVIAKVSGMTFEDYMDVNVLRPLGMRSTTFLPYQGPPEDLAWPHRGNLMPTVSAVYPYHRAHAPSSTLKSNLPDLSRWLAVHLNRGRLDGNMILSSSLMEGMWEPQSKVEDSGLKMALGWFLRSHRGNRMLLHAGRDPGFNTCIAFLPDHGVGVILLSNYDGQSAFEMVEIADGLLDIGQGRQPGIPKASMGVISL